MIANAPCFNCAHYKGLGVCPAFPTGIPEAILRRGADHDELIGSEAEPVVFKVRPGREEREALRRGRRAPTSRRADS